MFWVDNPCLAGPHQLCSNAPVIYLVRNGSITSEVHHTLPWSCQQSTQLMSIVSWAVEEPLVSGW